MFSYYVLLLQKEFLWQYDAFAIFLYHLLLVFILRFAVREGATGAIAPVDFQKTPFAPVDFPKGFKKIRKLYSF